MNQRVNIAKKILLPASFYAFMLIFIELYLRFFEVRQYIFPTPSSIFIEIFDQFSILIYHVGVSFLIAIASFLLGLLVAFASAVWLARLPILRRVALPGLIAMQAIPLIALAPYFLIWFGPGPLSRVLLSTLLVFFPALLIMFNGLRASNADTERLFKSIRVSDSQMFRYVSIPAAVPALASAMEVTAALSVIGAVVAELAGQPNGIGFVIIQATYVYDTPRVFAILAMGACASLVLYYVVGVVGRRLRKEFAFHYGTD